MYIPKFNFFHKDQSYAPMYSDLEKDENVGLTSSEQLGDGRGRRCSRCDGDLSLRRFSMLLYGGWLLSVLLTAVVIILSWSDSAYTDQRCFERTAGYSPTIKELPGHLNEVKFNGSIRWPSPYRGPPSPEVDRAWNDISIVRPLDLPITAESFLDIGSDPDTAAKNAPEFGGGYFAVPEFTHQLHCVNLLRKVSHFKFSYYNAIDPDFTDNIDVFKVHIDHCVEMLRQFVMCNADAGIVTAHWIEQRNRPWPDFNTKHVCRDFEGLLDWTREHQLPEGTPYMPMKPAGAKSMSSPP